MCRKKEQYCLYLKKKERKPYLPQEWQTSIQSPPLLFLKIKHPLFFQGFFLNTLLAPYVAAIHSKSVAQLDPRLLPLILFLLHFLHWHFRHLTFASFLWVNDPTKKSQPNKQTKKKTLWAMCGMCEHWFIRQPCINCFKVSLLVFPTVYIRVFIIQMWGEKWQERKTGLNMELGIYRILSSAVCIYESSVSQQRLQALLKYTIFFLEIWNLTQ